MKKLFSLFLATMLIFSLAVQSIAASPTDGAYPGSFRIDHIQQDVQPEPRPANLVRVTASNKGNGTIRCTILNTGIDYLDNATVYIQYANPKGYWSTVTKDYGRVGFSSMSEEFYIGTDWTSATAFWTITDGGEVMVLKASPKP